MMSISLGYASRSFSPGLPCGDGFLQLQMGPIQRVMFTDGIGHGNHAFQIVEALNQQLIWLCQRSQTYRISLVECLLSLHSMLKQRGHDHQAALALLDLDADGRRLDALIIGNIEVHYHQAGHHHALSALPGMVGGRLPSQPRLTHHDLAGDALLGLFSDGVNVRPTHQGLQAMVTKGNLDHLDMQAEAQTILALLGRPSDDASCALLRLVEEEKP